MSNIDRSKIVPFREKVDSLRLLIDKMKPQIQMALPRHLDADRMARIVLTSVQRTPMLLECTPSSLMGAILQAAQLGLEPDGVMGHGYLIPFRNKKKGVTECQFMPGYRGLMKLARQSGEISTLYARAVYEKDAFTYVCGLHEKLEHIPSSDEARGVLKHAYAVAKFKDGGYQFEVMSRSDIEAIRIRSRAGSEGPWVTDYEAMALKTVMKRLCKFIPGSVEKDQAVGIIDRAESGMPQDYVGDLLELPQEVQQEPSNTMDKLVEEKNKEREPGEEG